VAQTINADDGVISGSTGLKFTADTTGILALQNNGTTRVTVDSNGIVLVGLTSPLTVSGAATWQQQTSGTGATGYVLSRFSDNANPGRFITVKSRGASVGTNTIIQNGDELGSVDFAAADGTSYTSVVRISGFVDGVPGTGDIPTRITMSTSADGSATPTERMRIDSSGRAIFAGLIYHSSSTAVAAAGTTQGTATALTAQINNVTTGIDGTAGVILPTPIQAGLSIFIRNGSASLSLRIYPHSGGNISGTGVNAAIEIEFATVLEFIAFDTTNWYLPSAVLS